LANSEFAKRGGNLNLEDLKKKVTPDILKKAGLTEKDWQQFLKDARPTRKRCTLKSRSPTAAISAATAASFPTSARASPSQPRTPT